MTIIFFLPTEQDMVLLISSTEAADKLFEELTTLDNDLYERQC